MHVSLHIRSHRDTHTHTHNPQSLIPLAFRAITLHYQTPSQIVIFLYHTLILLYALHTHTDTHTHTHRQSQSPTKAPPPPHQQTFDTEMSERVPLPLTPQTFQSHHTAALVGPLILSGHTNPLHPIYSPTGPPVHSFLLWAATPRWAPLDPGRRQGAVEVGAVMVGEQRNPRVQFITHITLHWPTTMGLYFLSHHRVRRRAFFFLFSFL